MSNKVEEIIKTQQTYQKCSDLELKQETEKLKEEYQINHKLSNYEIRAFALVREAAKRVLQMEAFPVQLEGALELCRGHIIEMLTGEGKTLVSIFPAFLHALSGKGVHIITVNEYLADRDAHWVGKVLEFLGLSVGVSLSDMSMEKKKEAYACDVTYVTNSEVGFDYLRGFLGNPSQRGLHYCIIDEVDSVLIDEARTPLIISQPIEDEREIYISACALATKLKKGSGVVELSKIDAVNGIIPKEDGDYYIGEKDQEIFLTTDGVSKIESYFGIENYAGVENIKYQHHILTALKAKEFYHKNKEYIVRSGKVEIVDTFTGRILSGRRYSDGLHEALEAKEKLKIQKKSMTVARITYQSLFNLYDIKCGMTGTAWSARKEFREIYHLKVKKIRPNKPVIRKDHQDKVYTTQKFKYDAIVEDVVNTHQSGRPILIGTTNVKQSEDISALLKKKNLPHQVLNAKNHAKEAKIIAQAGCFGAITVATNMAGRGTDIKLDDKAKEVGGLKVIGTEKHDSVRIDNQLRGRAGRQGDAGDSVFYVSLEDRFLRLFGADKLQHLFAKDDNSEISTKMLINQIQKAQNKIEQNYYGVRKNLCDYDKVDNAQFTALIREIEKIKQDSNLFAYITHTCDFVLKEHKDALKEQLSTMMNVSTITSFETYVREKIDASFQIMKTNDELYEAYMQQLYQIFITAWAMQLQTLEDLKKVVSYQGYGRKPIDLYKNKAYESYRKMILTIQINSLIILLR